MKDVINPNVRNALDCRACNFEMSDKFNEQVLELIRKGIEEELTFWKEVTLVPYKLNIYEKGGFFKAHVDTPTDPSMIGSLVINLPSPHKVGINSSDFHPRLSSYFILYSTLLYYTISPCMVDFFLFDDPLTL